MHSSLDLALFGGFILLSFGLILFRRFHHYETLVKPEDLGPTAWGLYGGPQEKTAVAKTPAKKRRH